MTIFDVYEETETFGCEWLVLQAADSSVSSFPSVSLATGHTQSTYKGFSWPFQSHKRPDDGRKTLSKHRFTVIIITSLLCLKRPG